MDPNRLRTASFGSDRLDIYNRLEEDRKGSVRSYLSPLLLSHPEDDISDYDLDSPRLVGGSDYVRQNLRMTACFLVLLVGYAVERLACSAGLPKDCLATINYYEFFSDVTSLLLYGLALGWFIGISEHSRFSWLFHPRRWYAGMTFLLTPPVYSAISNIDELKFDLTDFSKWSAPFIGLWAIAMGAIAAVICWHILAAWRRAGPASFAVYIITRLVMLGWFAASAFIISNSGSPMKIHLHHLYIGWALAIWADLNHPVSAVTVAVGAGIFVQGVGAYSFAPIFTPHGCFETPATASIKCKFWAEKPFTLQVCGTAGDIAHHKCT